METTAGTSGGAGTLYTIGHSNHSLEAFITLLAVHKIDILVDVRSRPVSRFCPHFNHRMLSQYLPAADIRYLYLGKQLGGRPDRDAPENARFYTPDGQIKYGELAASDAFQQGLAQLQQTIANARVAIMCSEEDPLKCHRYMLISRSLASRGVPILHIRKDASLLMHVEVPSDGSLSQLSLF